MRVRAILTYRVYRLYDTLMSTYYHLHTPNLAHDTYQRVSWAAQNCNIQQRYSSSRNAYICYLSFLAIAVTPDAASDHNKQSKV